MKFKYLKWPLIGLVLFGMFIGSFGLLKDWRFNRDAPEADFPPPRDLAEARMQDVAHLALFFTHERSWTEETLAAARQAHEQLRRTAAEMSDAQFELAVARVVALADNAHTKIREYGRTPRYNRLPVRGHWFEDGYHIVRAYKGFEQLLGHRIVAIDDVPFEQASAALRPYIAGPHGTFRKYVPYLIESPQLMHAAGVARSPDRVTLTLVNDNDPLDDAPKNVVFEGPFPDSGDQIARTHYLLTSQIYLSSQPDWSGVSIESESPPPYLDYPDIGMQWRELPELEAGYLQFWGNNNVGDTSISSFCDRATERYRNSGFRYLVLDHRFNGGGNLNLTRDCMKELARTIPEDGFIYILIGGSTFSAGIYSAAFARHEAGDRAVLIGEAIGDGLQSWGEDNLLRLPNSKIEIKFSTGMHDLQNGCTDWGKCHWDVPFLKLRIDDLDPDIHAPLNYKDFLAGRDPAIDAIRIHQQQNTRR